MKKLDLIIAHIDGSTVMVFDTRRPSLGAVPASSTIPGKLNGPAFPLEHTIRAHARTVPGYKILGFVEAKNGRRMYGVLEKPEKGFFARLINAFKPKTVTTLDLP